MALGTTATLALLAAGAGASYYNTQNVAKKQDNQAAATIERQGRKQKQADQRVDQQVQELEASTSADERASRLDSYMQTLAGGKEGIESGFSPRIGSDAFRDDSAKAAGDVNTTAQRLAGLMSRIDAPTEQRRGEAFGYGNLATDLNLVSREAQGMKFLDDLKLRGIKRNPWLDAFSATASGAASSGGSGGAIQSPFGPGTI